MLMFWVLSNPSLVQWNSQPSPPMQSNFVLCTNTLIALQVDMVFVGIGFACTEQLVVICKSQNQGPSIITLRSCSLNTIQVPYSSSIVAEVVCTIAVTFTI